MNPYRRRNLVVLCLLSLVLTVSAQAVPRYTVWTPIGTPTIYQPDDGDDIRAGLTITLKCNWVSDYDYDNETCSTVYDGATITWTAKDAYNNDVGTWIDDSCKTAEWTAPMVAGPVTIYATADDNPYYLADDAAQQDSITLNIVTRVYVDCDATGDDNGSDWENAFTDLQDALALAGSGWEVWVAEGTYYPGASQSDTFTISGEAVYGGFAGTETTNNPTGGTSTLSGDIDSDGLDNGNCYRVVSISAGTLDGFTIEQGYGSTGAVGAGMHVSGSPTINECVIRNNQTNGTAGSGGGLYLNSSSATITGCDFEDNQAGGDGGAVYISGGSPTFEDCDFDDNSSFDDGGAVNCNNASTTMTDCEFTDNQTTGSGGMGGAIEQSSGSLTLIDCDITGNTAQRHGGGLRVSGGTTSVTGGTVSYNESICHDGGGLEFQDCTADVNDVTITYNEAMYNSPPDTRRGDGGGICIERSTVTVSNCTIQYNSCDDDGGGIRAKGDDWAGSTLIHLNRGNTVTNNSPDNISIDGDSQEQ
jgi:hypothetical protein